jgi:hypothetical protein
MSMFSQVADRFNIQWNRTREDGRARRGGFYRYSCTQPIGKRCVGHYLASKSNAKSEAVKHLKREHAYSFARP